MRSRWAFPAGGVGAAAILIAVVLGKVRASGAVPVDEFGPAPLLYGSRPWLLVLGLLAASTSIVWMLPCRRRGAGTAALGLLLTAVGAAFPALIPPGVVLYLLGAVLAALAGAGHAAGVLEAPGLRGFIGALTAAIALATAATWLLGMIESRLLTERFVPGILTPGELAGYRRALFGLALSFGVQVGALAVLGLVAVWLVHRGLARLSSLRPSAEPLLFSLLLGLAAGIATLLVFRITLGDELREIGIAGEIALIFALAGLALGRYVHANVGRAGAVSRGFFRGAARRLLLGLVPPSERILRSGLLRSPTILVVGLVGLAVLSTALYPTVEDFRGEVFDSYAWLTVLLGTVLLTVLLPARFAGRAALALLLVEIGAAAALGSGGPATKRVAHEHSRIGALAAMSIPARLLDSFPRIGREEEPDVRFSHHPAGEDRLPELPPELSGRRERPPILLVIWDAARPDHLSAYGYDRPTTPNLERLASRSVVFTKVYTTATATTAAVRNMLTGRYCTRYMLSRAHPPFVTRELAEAGYDRFVITVTGNDRNGVSAEAFERGWDAGGRGLEFLRVESPNRDCIKPDVEKTDRVIDAFRRIRAERGSLSGTFAYIHLTGTHTPWLNRDPAADFGGEPADLYDGEIAKADRLLGKLLEALAEMGEEERAVVVVTADHGTGLLEHGRYAGFFPYEEQVRVPLVVRVPGLPTRVVDDRVALIDVAPTIVGLLFPGRRHRHHGRSLMPLLSGERDSLSPRPIVAYNSFRDAYAVIGTDGRWKLHHDRERRYEALFDLAADPGETRNRIAVEPDTADRLRRTLSVFLFEGRGDYANPYHYRGPAGR